ncbi:hypothetical protein SBOR_3213 [Sclerotinia borealis F-4128]|uniref:Uncharacterized protein n=1 Tax=Sclerotinia borealis (strain F-4128) TaxID=1432307 RepID=W9CKL6_SCLBF|nr:hypothetical protein SBOR_3213 [Sclerotinia borealis F-4128]
MFYCGKPSEGNMCDLAFGNGRFAVIEKAKAEEKARRVRAIGEKPRGTRTTIAARAKPTIRASSSIAGTSKLKYIAAIILGEARYEHIVALMRVNDTLRSPVYEAKDRTLLSIMVLVVFETETRTSRLFLKAWTEHITGASTLLELRGPSQFRTRAGIGLFMQITTHILISALQREVLMPPEIMALRATVYKQLNARDPAFKMLSMLDKFAYFRSDLQTGKQDDSEHVIATGEEIEATDLIFEVSYDIYYGYWIAYM